ncbi:T9SS type A sorting domain-containing protein [bacterium]|nr:T9SS type A sorting domain-containing protein [bacterium]
MIEQFYDDYEEDIAMIAYHVWWPGGGDIWYLRNTQMWRTRADYYGVGQVGVPYCRADGGANFHPGTRQNLVNAFDGRIDIESPIAIDIMTFGGDGSPISVMATIESGDEAIEGNYKLHCVLITNENEYNAPNGQTEWKHDAMDMAPGANGQDFEIEANSIETFELEFEWDEEYYDNDNLSVVVFVQNDGNRNILQSNVVEFSPGWDFALTQSFQSAVTTPGTVYEFDYSITNIGVFDDTYDLVLDTNLPEGFDVFFTTPDGEMTETGEIELEVGESYEGVVSITCSDMEADHGTLSLGFTSQDQPALSRELNFFVHNEANIAIINGEVQGRYAHFYTDAIEEVLGANTPAIGEWPRAVFPLVEADLGDFDPEMIIWLAGGEGELIEEEILYLTDFLANGGNLFLTGSELPHVLDDTDLIDMMGTNYRGRLANARTLFAEEGDQISEGIDISINGGDGADNRGEPTYMHDPDDGAGASWWMSPNLSRAAAIWNVGDGYNSLIFGFPFEAIAAEADRNRVMGNIVEFFGDVFGEGAPGIEIAITGNRYEMISFPIMPANLAVEDVFGGLDQLGILYQDNGSYYIPNLINTIGDINLSEGYRVFSSADDMLEIEGELVDPMMEFMINGGRWNWIGYPMQEELPVDAMLAQIADDVAIVMNDDGDIWIPDGPNTIENMVPGTGYFVFANNNVSFTYGDMVARTGSSDEVWDVPQAPVSVTSTGLPYAVLVSLSDNLRAQASLIELYDGSTLVGNGVVLEDRDVSPVIAWQGDAERGLEGFVPGHVIDVMVLREDGSILAANEVTPSAKFGEGAFATMNLESMELPQSFVVEAGYPNPFNPTVTVPFTLPNAGDVQFQVFNVLGQKIFDESRTFEAGRHQFLFDANQHHSLVSGIYLLQVNYKDQMSRQKLNLVK